MDYDTIKKTLLEVLEVNFDTANKKEIAGSVDNIFLIYKYLQDFSLRQEFEHDGNSKFYKQLGIEYHEADEYRKRIIKKDSIKDFLEKEDLLISYIYGGYISSKIAHACYQTSFYSEELKEKIYSGPGYFKFWPQSLNTPEIKKELKKYAFSLKNMFIKKVIDEGKKKKYSDAVTYSKDTNGKPVLSVNVKYIYDNDGNVINYREEFEEASAGIISVHVIDKELMDAIQSLQEVNIEHSMNPQDILNLGSER